MPSPELLADAPRADRGLGGRGRARGQAEALPPSGTTVSVHLVEACGDGRAVRVRAVTEPMEEWGLGGGIVSTAAPAAAAVRLLARGEIDARGALPPERCIDPAAMFAELEPRGCRFEVTAPRGGEGMKVGVPTEIKPDEYRVALTPVGRAGARRARPRGADPARAPGRAARSPTPTTRPRARGSSRRRGRLGRGRPGPEGQGAAAARRSRSCGPSVTLFTYLHLAPAPGSDARPVRLGRHLRRLRDGRGQHGPASAAGADERDRRARSRPRPARSCSRSRSAAGASCSGACPGSPPANVMIIGGGAVGMNAAFIAIGMEADVFVYDTQPRPPARARRRLRRARLDRLLVDALDRGAPARGWTS